MAISPSPTVYLLAGPNGAGKTTFATLFLPDFVRCREFLNADLIAAGLSPFAPETQALRAGRLLLTRIKELAQSRQDFGFETTLAGLSYVKTINDLKQSGYEVGILFLWLPDVAMAVERVANRHRQGGHNIPEAIIHRRYVAGLRNFVRLYAPLADFWWIYDARDLPPQLAVSSVGGTVQEHQPGGYATVQSFWKDLSDD
jgi:predicted ABC-type ATPase